MNELEPKTPTRLTIELDRYGISCSPVNSVHHVGRDQSPTRLGLVDIEDRSVKCTNLVGGTLFARTATNEVTLVQDFCSPNIVTEDDLQKPAAIDQPCSLEQVLILLLPLLERKCLDRFVLVVLIDSIERVDNPVVIPAGA